MKFPLFYLLLSAFSFSAFAQSGELYPEETDKMFTTHVRELMYSNFDSLKGDFVQVEGNDSIFICDHMLWGFKPYIKKEGRTLIFYGMPKTNPQPPEFNRILGKLTQIYTILNYKIMDSETDADLKAKATSIKLARIVSFNDLNYAETDVETSIVLYLFPDGNYDVSVYNQVAETARANAPYVYRPQTFFSYNFTEAPTQWLEYSNKWTSSAFKKGKWQIANKAENTKYGGWEFSFMCDFNSGDNPDFELTASFANIASIDTAYYGYSYTTKCKDEELYDHVNFLFNKKNHTFSVYESAITGSQFSYQGVKNYRAKNVKCLAPAGGTADVLGIRRYKGKVLFSVNNEIVFTMPDAHPLCPLSTGADVMVVNKVQLEVDDMIFNYAPAKESSYFKTVAH